MKKAVHKLIKRYRRFKIFHYELQLLLPFFSIPDRSISNFLNNANKKIILAHIFLYIKCL